jgi:HEAT repeat protein
MKKHVLFLIAAASLLLSCATVKQPIDTQYWEFHKIEKIIPEELYSSDEDVKAKSAAVFGGLTDESKRQVMTYLAYTLSDEKDPVVRAKIFAALTEFNAGAYVVAPLIESARANSSAVIFREVKAFTSRFKPSELELAPLVKFLKDPDWNVKLTAAKIIGLMSQKARTALPEMFDAMRSVNDNSDRYAEIYNAASMINPRIAILQVIVDMHSKDKNISRNSINTLFELYMFLNKDSNTGREILPALVRLMYSEDETLSKTSHEMIASIGDEDSVKAVKSYIAFSKIALKSMANMAGQKLQDKFKQQEDDIVDEIAVYYKMIGREDALNGVKK